MPARRLSSLVLVVCAIAWTAGLAARQTTTRTDPQQPIRAEATFVRVDVYPTRDGRPVEGLTVDDFELREDGVAQKIESFEHVRVPVGAGRSDLRDPGSQREMLQQAANPRARVVVVFLDVNYVDIFGSHETVEPIIKLVNRLLGPEDLVGIMTPEMSASQVVLARKTELLEEQLRKHWDWGKAGDTVPRLTEREIAYELCYPPLAYPGVAAQMIAKAREAQSLEAMQDLVRYLGAIREERKAIIAVSGGWRLMRENPGLMELRGNQPIPGKDKITVGPTGQPTRHDPRASRTPLPKPECEADRMHLAHLDNQRTFRDLLDDANRANASFYPVDPRGLVAPTATFTPRGWQMTTPSNTIDRLRELADNTDGIAVVDTNNLDAGMSRIVADLTSYYLLGYNSTNAKLDGKYRRIQVKVRGDGLDVRHRRGYRAAVYEEVEAARAAAAPPVDNALQEALGALSRVRPGARFRTHVAHVTMNGSTTMWIAGELEPAAGSGAPPLLEALQADVEAQAGDHSARAQGIIKPGERSFVTSVTLAVEEAPDATVRARLADAGAGVPVSDELRASVGPRSARPLLFRRGPSTANRIVPTANPAFTRNDRVRVELPVPPDANPGAARLLDKAGTPLNVPVVLSARSDDSGQRWIVGDLVLAPLAAGDYLIELAPQGLDRSLTAIRVTR